VRNDGDEVNPEEPKTKEQAEKKTIEVCHDYKYPLEVCPHHLLFFLCVLQC
jgi:hypothetical protein